MTSGPKRADSARLARGQDGVPDSFRAVRLGRRHEVAHERRLTAQRDLHVRAAGQLQHRARVLGHLAGVDVAGDAGHGDEVRLR